MVLTKDFQLLKESYVGNANNGHDVYLRIYARVSSQGYDIENNKTKIYVKSVLYDSASSGYWWTGNTTTKSLSCTGLSSVSSSANGNYYPGETVLCETSGEVYHNQDGTKSITVSANFTSTPWGWNKTISASAELPTIPRASTPSVTGTLQLGSEITINANRASDSFIHNLYYSWGSQIQNKRFATGIGASTTWTIPKDLADHIPNGTSGTLFIICETYKQADNDELTLIGTKTINVTVEVPNTAEFKPSISQIALSEAVNGIFEKFGTYIQNQSKVNCSITAQGAYSSTIKIYKVVVNGSTYNEKSFTTDFLKLAGTNTISVTITDSRGRTATDTAEFEVLAYDGPTITKFIANRCFEDGTLDDEGEFAKVEIIATMPSLNKKNTYSYVFQYRDIDEDQFTQYEIEMTEEKTDTLITISGSFVIAADGNNSFDYMFEVSDTFLKANKVKGIDTVFQLINFNASGKGMAFGKVSEKDALEIAMKIYDEFGTLFTNGLAEYENGEIDANTTLSHLCLAQYNTPNNSLYFVMTFFYGTKSVESNRTQIAIPYIFDKTTDKKNIFIRQFVTDTWNEWTQI